MFSIRLLFALICVTIAATTVVTITSSFAAQVPHPSLTFSFPCSGDEFVFIPAFIAGIVETGLRNLFWVLGPNVKSNNEKLICIEQLLKTPLDWDKSLRFLMALGKNLLAFFLIGIVSFGLLDLVIYMAFGENANAEQVDPLLEPTIITIKEDYDRNHFVFLVINTTITGADIVVHEGPTWDQFEVSITRDYRSVVENPDGVLTIIPVEVYLD